MSGCTIIGQTKTPHLQYTCYYQTIRAEFEQLVGDILDSFLRMIGGHKRPGNVKNFLKSKR